MRNNPNAGQWENGVPPQRVHDYVAWLVSPEGTRTPTTKTAYAAEHSISPSTLKDWERDDRVKKLIRDSADKLNMSGERIQQVMNAMWNKAQGGDVQAAKLYMDHVDKIMPRDGGGMGGGYEDMSDEELHELARELVGTDG